MYDLTEDPTTGLLTLIESASGPHPTREAALRHALYRIPKHRMTDDLWREVYPLLLAESEPPTWISAGLLGAHAAPVPVSPDEQP